MSLACLDIKTDVLNRTKIGDCLKSAHENRSVAKNRIGRNDYLMPADKTPDINQRRRVTNRKNEKNTELQI